ncbi:Uncharacterised protein [uncultured archaeon]|nr:Uncharacterised protein [uncultured archaeon]
MNVGIYSTDDLLQKWYLKELVNARNVLKEFTFLNQLFDEFKGYESKQYSQTRNVVLFLSLPNFNGFLKHNSIKSLTQLEDSIKLFDVTNWAKAKLNNLKSSLCNDEYDKSLSPFTELTIAKQLAERIREENVELYPKLQNGRFSDVLITLNGKSVYIEIGNLGEGKPQKKIQSILDASAEYLGQKLGTTCYLEIEIDTAEFVFDGNIMNVEKSISKLNSEIDKYGIQKLAGFEGWFMLEEIIEMVRSLSLYEDIDRTSLLLPQDKELLNLVKDSRMNEWISYCNSSKLVASKLIKSIIGSPSKYLLVEIHTENVYPSRAAFLEQGSFVNRIIRHIIKQVYEEKQIQPNKPNIVLVQCYNWIASGIENFEPIHTGLMKFFDDVKEKNLSGVAVFSTDFDNTMYISNKYAVTESKLNESDIAQLGFRWS